MSTRKRLGRNTNETSRHRGGHLSGRRSRRRAVIAAAVITGAACLMPKTTMASTTDIWTGQSGVDTNWGTSGNWVTTNPGGIPVTDDLLNFNGSINLVSTDNITGLTIDGLTFGSGAGAYILNGSTPLTLDFPYETAAATPTFTGGFIINSSAASTTTETINLPINFTGGNHTVTTAAGSGGLVFGGAVTTSAGTSVQFNTAGGAINLTGSGLSNTNGILGGWATIGNSLATINGSGNVSAYTSATAVSASFNANANLTTNYNITASGGTLLITPASGDSFVDVNSIVWTPSTAATETIESATASIPIRLGAQGVIMNTNGAAGSMTFGGGTTYSLTAGGANNTSGNIYLIDLNTAGAQYTGGNVSINEKIVDNGTGKVSVTTLGSVNFAAITNTYSGGTYINGGDLYVNNGVLGTGAVYVYSGGRADYGNNNNATVANNFFIEGYGFVSGSTNNPGAIKGAYKGTITGNIVLLGSASIDPNSGTAYSTISGTISGNGSFTVGGTNTGLVGGAITLGGLLSYTGDTIIDNTANKAAMGINISTGANNIMPNGSLTGNLDIIGGSSQATTFNLEGTTQTINALTTPSGTVSNAIVTSTVAGGVLTLGGNNATGTFSGNISGTTNLSLIKIGTGTQTLGGANTYTGGTNISNGILAFTGTVAGSSVGINGGILAGTATFPGAVTLNSGGINPGAQGPSSIGTLTLSNGLTINGGNLGFDLGTSTNDKLTVAGTINFAGASTLTPSGGTPGSSYNLVSGTMTGSNVPTIVEPVGTTRFSYSYGSNSYNGSNGGNTLVIVVNGQIGNLTWNNAAGGDGLHWDVVGQKNWASSATVGNPNQFYQGDNVTFNDSNNGNYNVLVTTTVNPGSVTVSTNGAYNISGTGTIGGTAALSMTSPSGTGSLLLSGSNAYSGGTTLNSGKLYINNVNALGSGALTINGGTIDNTSAAPITIYSIPQVWNSSSVTFVGTQSLNLGAGLVTLNASPVVTVSNNTLTVGGNITGTGQSLTKADNGTLVLGGLSNYSGGTTVNAGTLTLAGNSLGAGTIIGTLNINPGATVIASATNALGYSTGTSVTNVNIIGGLLNSTAASDQGWGIAYVLTGGTLENNGGVSSNAAAGDFSFGGPAGQDTSVTTLASSATSVIAGRINLRNDNGQPNVTFNVAQGTVTTGPTPGVDLLVSAAITQNTGGDGIVLKGAGVMSLTGANNYTGVTNISGGTLLINSLAIEGTAGGVASAIGASNNSAGNLIINGGTLRYAGPAQTTDRLFTLLPGGGAIDSSGTGALNFNNTGSVYVPVTGARTLTFTGTNTGNNIFASVITDSVADGSPTSVTKTGAGSWTLGGSNTYSGPTTVSQGILSIGSTGSLAGGGVQVNSGGTLAGSGTVNGAVNVSSGGILTGGSAGSGTLSLTNGLNLGANPGDTETINAFANAASPTSPSINVGASNVAVNGGAHSVVINVGQIGILAVGEYELLSYGNGSIGGTGNSAFILGTLPNRVIGALDFNYAAGQAIDLNITAIDFPVWTGARDGTWVTSPTVTTGEPDNWVLNSNNAITTDFVQGDTVLFNDIATTGNVNISSGNVQPTAISFNNSAVAYTIFSGGSYGITGNATLTKMGTGALTISTANTYAGGTTLLTGTLNINNASALGTGTLNISGGSIDNTSAAPITLSTNNSQIWSGNFTFNGTQSLNMGSGTVALNANITLNVSNGTLTVPGTVTNGTVGTMLTKTGAGTLILGGDNTFNGGLTINAGSVQVTTNGGGETGLGGGPNASGTPVVVNAGGTLIGGGTDAFGYSSPTNSSPSSIEINGGTVTDLGTSSYRVTLGDIQLTGGTLTSNTANTGAAQNTGEYSFFTATIETNPSNITSVISAGTISIQTQNMNGSAVFTIAQGNTSSGVDLLVSSNLVNFLGYTNGLNKAGSGVMELSGTNTYNGGTIVNAGTLIFASAASLPGTGHLYINNNATVQILAHAANTSQTVLTVPVLFNYGLIDVTNNAMIVVSGGSLASLTTQVQQGYNNGAWNGTSGIISSAAANDSTHLTAVGVIQNGIYGSPTDPPLYGSGTALGLFEGANPVAADVLVKYTYYGDANLDGKVDGSDYSLIDNGFTMGLTGWFNGDFNYDGVIDGSDYALIDNSFNTQGSQISAQVSADASATAEIAGAASAVPEPTTLMLGAIGCLGLLGRRKRPV